LQNAENGQLDANEAERLATEALVKKQEMEANSINCLEEKQKNELQVENLQKNTQKMKATISKWENELRTLRARHQVSEATKNINKQLAAIDSQSTVAMLERMRERVLNQEALSEAYADINNEYKSIDEEIDNAINLKKVTAQTELLKLKERIKENNENKV